MPKHSNELDAEKFAHQLVALLEKLGQPRHGSGSYLSKKYKVAGVTANAWLNGEHKPDVDLARIMASDFGMPFEDFYFAKGNLSENTPPEYSEPLVYVDKVAGAQLSAGNGHIAWDFERIDKSHAFRLSWMQKKGLRADKCKVWTVSGESMWPYYPHGSWVLINEAQREPLHGKNFGLIGEDGFRLKQLRRSESGGWTMHSLNPDQNKFPPEPIVSDNYTIIGRVRGHGGDDD